MYDPFLARGRVKGYDGYVTRGLVKQDWAYKHSRVIPGVLCFLVQIADRLTGIAPGSADIVWSTKEQVGSPPPLLLLSPHDHNHTHSSSAYPSCLWCR